MERLLDTMRTLRGPEGCPWDREQTHLSLRPYLLEEAAEAVDALTEEDARETVNELGDVLLQVAFHSVIAEEAGEWAYSDVENAIVEKLLRRHPHVFGDVHVQGSDEVVRNWQAIKAGEGGKEKTGAKRVPGGLGALAREAEAQKLLGQRQAGRADLDLTLDTAPENAAGVAAVLGAVVAWARSLGVDPELALREHTNTLLHSAP